MSTFAVVPLHPPIVDSHNSNPNPGAESVLKTYLPRAASLSATMVGKSVGYRETPNAEYREAAARQGWTDATDFNEPHDPDCFFVNEDGLRLCIGRWLPPQPQDVRACVVYIHGYGHHFHTLGDYFKRLAESGIAVVALDQAGHGYSEGVRCYVPSIEPFLRDIWQLVDVMHGGVAENLDGEGRKFSFNLPDGQKDAFAQKMAEVPFFINGQSMGGGLSIAFGHRLQSTTDNPPAWKKLFAGAALTAPLVTAGKVPAAPVLFALRHILAPLFKTSEVR